MQVELTKEAEIRGKNMKAGTRVNITGDEGRKLIAGGCAKMVVDPKQEEQPKNEEPAAEEEETNQTPEPEPQAKKKKSRSFLGLG